MFWTGFLVAISLILGIYGIVKAIETLITDAVKDETQTLLDRISHLESVTRILADKVNSVVVKGESNERG